MLIRFIVSIPLIVSIIAAPVCSASGGHRDGGEENGQRKSVFASISGYDMGKEFERPVLKLKGKRLESPGISREEFMRGRDMATSTAGKRKKRIAISVLASAVVPGLGHAYLYSGQRDNSILLRIPLFLAAEGYFWYGYFHNHNKGKDIKEDYMNYADQHWSLDRFLDQHPCCEAVGGCDSWQHYNEYCSVQCGGGDCIYFLYTPRSVDEEEYYENLGKYKAFVYGWDDWESGQTSVWTPHRNYYWSLRSESDDYLLRGDQYLMLLMVNRVISMLDAGWLAYRMGQGEGYERSWSLEAGRGITDPRITLNYNF